MSADEAVVVERVVTPRGELALRRRGERHEIVSNGVFLMDTSDGRSERLLVTAAIAAAPPRPLRVLVGGLGVGFSLAEACASQRVAAVTVVEIEPQLVAWHATHLRPLTADTLADPRVRVVVADLAEWLRTTGERFDVVCLDVDNGPHWTVADANAALYDATGTARLAALLPPDGVLAVWSAAAVPAYEDALRSVFATVTAHEVPVARGAPDVVYVAGRPNTADREARR